jgi:ankyrin repeat protein
VNLEQLRKQAKELVRAARSGDADALSRLGDLPVQLASAQLVLARDHGYASWPALVHTLEATVESFVVAATSGRCEWARRLLDARQEIADDPWAALVLGRGWDGDVSAPGGPHTWAPLLYVTYSCFASVELAREPLARGADPNVTLHNEYGDMPALYGAAGVVHDPELTRLLLEAGANPNDGESLYHSMEAEDPACMRVLLEHGADPRGTAALPHAIDYDRLEYARALLEAGADPNEGHWALLVHAVRRGCGLQMVRLLVDHGADLDRRGGEWSTQPEEYRTAYQNAVLRNRDDVVGLLAELGASTDVAPEDVTVAALALGKRPTDPLPSKLSPDAQEALILAALGGQLQPVVEVLGPAFVGHNGGGPPGTLLHHACWIGNTEVVGRLLELGANPTASGEEYNPLVVWAALGSQYHTLPARDYVAVVEQLVAAGAVLEEDLQDVSEGPLADWLEDHLALEG